MKKKKLIWPQSLAMCSAEQIKRVEDIISQMREILILLMANKVDDAEIVFNSASDALSSFFLENKDNKSVLNDFTMSQRLQTVSALCCDISDSINKLIAAYGSPNTAGLRANIKQLKTYS